MLSMLSGSAWSAEPSLPSPQTLMAQIQAESSRTVLDRLWTDTSRFDALCAAIETADPAWLEVARSLKPGADAAVSLSLNYCVARALPEAPEHVLALIGNGFSIEDICTSPFIEPMPGVAERHQSRAIDALQRVSTPDLADVRDQCLAEIAVPLKWE